MDTETTVPNVQDNPHLSDPALTPFLTENFSIEDYLNSTLPPLLPPATLSTKRPQGGVSLSELSAKTTTLLSTIDLQTERLLATLQTLTDEILRITPRLSYEVESLRSDVVALGEELEGNVASQIAAVTGEDAKPEGLERLLMLSKVRERVEEVVKVFGEAMGWNLDDPDAERKEAATETKASSQASRMEGPRNKSKGQNPPEEILYLIAAGELDSAQSKVDSLQKLASVFDNTVEGTARHAVVDALQEKVKVAREKVEGKKDAEIPKENPVERRQEEKKEESGYYGLIEQLKGLRGMT